MFLAQYVTRSTVLKQDVWVFEIDWDKELKKACRNGTVKLFQNLNEFPHIKVPRCLRPSGERGSF